MTPTAAALQRFIAQPVRPLVVAVLARHDGMLVLGLVDVVHEEVHRLPVLVDNVFVAKLLPHRPRHNDAGICPAQPHHVAVALAVACPILCERCDARESTGRRLRVPHVPHPLMEEAVCVGEERSGLGEDLCVGRPTKAFVALRAVRRDRQIVGALAPKRVGDELVDVVAARHDSACLHLLRDGRDGDGLDAADRDLVRGGYRHIAIAEEGAARSERPIALRVVECVAEYHARVRDAEVQAMAATFRPVHAATLCAVAVVQKLARQASQHGAGFCLELEGRYCGSILAEIHHECLARTNRHGLARNELLDDVDLAELVVGCTCRALPSVGLDGRQSEVPAMINLCAVGRPNLSLKFLIEFRLAEQGVDIYISPLMFIVVLAVEDGGMRDRTSHTSLPVLQVRGEILLGAVCVGQHKHASESHLLAYHAIVTAWRYNLISPPARYDLHGEEVFLSCAFVEGLRDVVSKAVLRLLEVREAGLQDLVADQLTIDVKIVGAQGGGLPDGPLHLLRISGIADEPACAIGCTRAIDDFSRYNLRIFGAYPNRFVPRLAQMILDEFADCLLCVASKSTKHQAC